MTGQEVSLHYTQELEARLKRVSEDRDEAVAEAARFRARAGELGRICHRLHAMLGLAAGVDWAVIPDVVAARTGRAADRLDEFAGPGGASPLVEVRRAELRGIASTIRPIGPYCGPGEQR